MPQRERYLLSLGDQLAGRPDGRIGVRAEELARGLGFRPGRSIRRDTWGKIGALLGHHGIVTRPVGLPPPPSDSLLTLEMTPSARSGRRSRARGARKRARKAGVLPLEDRTLVAVAVGLAGADAPPTDREIGEIRRWLLEGCAWPVDPAALERALEEGQRQPAAPDLKAAARVLEEHFDSVEWVWVRLLDLAAVDGPPVWREKLFLYRLAEALGLPDRSVAELEASSRLAADLQLLGLDAAPGAGEGVEGLRRAFTLAARVVHPDRHPEEPLRLVAERLFKLLEGAYGRLGGQEGHRR